MNHKIFTLTLFFFLQMSMTFGQELVSGSIEYDGELRRYNVYLPSGYQSGIQLPLVFNLHGFDSDTLGQNFYTGMNLVADSENFIVLIPQGLTRTTGFGQTGAHWNAYFGTDVDDLGFLDLMIDKMYTDYNVDLSRVYSTGMSNGGFMSYRLACELSDRVAAIASVTGSVIVTQLDNCTPARAVPIMHVHGTADNIVNYNGVPSLITAVPDLIDFWVNHNNCDTPADTIPIPDINITDNSTVDLFKYENGDDNSRVWLYKVENGGHTWPDATIDLPGNVTNRDFNASQHIWDFFKDVTHPNPTPGTMILSNKDLLLESIKIVAYPTRQELRVTSDKENIEQVQIWDLMGRKIAEVNNENNQREMNIKLPKVPTGIYIATVNTDKGSISQKIFF